MEHWKLSAIKRAVIDGVSADFRMIETETEMTAGSGIALIHVKDSTEANARLIAAAPELLEALQAVLKLAEDGVIQRSETGKPQWNMTDELQAIARAAIQRAEG